MAPEASVSADVVDALSRRFGPLVPAGAGAWSTAFRADQDGRPIIVRVGEHVSDFLVDADMARYAQVGLPIPEVFEVSQLNGPHGHLHICVSSFAPGTALEAVDRDDWVRLVPAVVDLLDTMRTIAPPNDKNVPAWPRVLLDRDDGDMRLDGWHDALASRPDELAVYRSVMERLASLCELPHVAQVTPTLLHCDLINRNVHVEADAITGVFDWGCRRWGDHLYELAWFEFWAPWHPTIDVGLLRSELVARWGEEPDPDRLAACLAHIGADHIVYHASIGETAAPVIDRLQSLGLGSRRS